MLQCPNQHARLIYHDVILKMIMNYYSVWGVARMATYSRFDIILLLLAFGDDIVGIMQPKCVISIWEPVLL